MSTMQKRASDLVAGDIIEVGVTVYDVLAVERELERSGHVAVAVRQRHRDRLHRVLIFGAEETVRLCSSHEGIPEGVSVLDFECRRLRDELRAIGV